MITEALLLVTVTETVRGARESLYRVSCFCQLI